MSMWDRYTSPVQPRTWDVPATGAARFTWEYDNGRERLLALYQKGKDKQWDSQKRIDWHLEVDPVNPSGRPDKFNPLMGSDIWDKLPQKKRDEYTHHHGAWLFSQFLHGEQGALTVAARIVESAPDLDSKFYAATQVMDEARHVELYNRFIQEKIGIYYPINPSLAQLLAEALEDSRWDLPYLGMQVLIEGLALAGFGVYRDMSSNELVRQLLAYVMQDEARHVAFGRLALKEYYSQLTEAERAEREEFIVEGCYLMRDRFRGQEVFETVGLPADKCMEYANNSPITKNYQARLFTRVVPCVRDIGLWGERVQRAYEDMGVLDAAQADLGALMTEDEQIAEQYDAAKQELADRRAEVDEAIAAGSE